MTCMEQIKGSSIVLHTDTFNRVPEDKSDTSCHTGNENPLGACLDGYNRRVRRYARKHGVSLDKAFAAIYGGKGK